VSGGEWCVGGGRAVGIFRGGPHTPLWARAYAWAGRAGPVAGRAVAGGQASHNKFKLSV
jgi:hypothetical protein